MYICIKIIMDSSRTLFFFTALLFIAISPSNLVFAQRSFSCNATVATCNALIDYVPPNATTLSHIQTLFTVENLSSILGANNLPTFTLSNHTVPANRSIKIPFSCACSNGTGVPKQPPVYTVATGDFLYHIAAEVFSGLVSVQQIQVFNGIPDPDKINLGQELKIPLPCSCDEVDGQQVVHYGHVVERGSSLEGIAGQYNTSVGTLERLNNVTAQELQAGEVLDVPLRACSSLISNTSRDYPLLVSNGTYVFTANNCVMCSCDASVSWKLQCRTSPVNSSHCQPVRCAEAGNLALGNTTTSGCNRTTCAYAGFNNQRVLATLDSESTCPASGGNGSPSSSSAISLQGGLWRRWNQVVLVIFIHVLLLCVSLL